MRKLEHGHPENHEYIQNELDSAKQQTGPTLFDLIVEIIESHGPDGSEPEDDIKLELLDGQVAGSGLRAGPRSGHAAGARGIAGSGRLVANSSGNVYVTQDMLSSTQASTNLFAGNPSYAGKGSNVVVVRVPEGVNFVPGTQANEFIIQGSTNVDVIYAGPNPFG
jgi:hypothetical protein